MKRYILSVITATVAVTVLAQVQIPFDVPVPTWKGLVTPNMNGQLFRTSALTSDLLLCIEGPEFDDYEWHTPSSEPLNEGETTWVLCPDFVFPVISDDDGFMVEVEFNATIKGYTQSYGLREVENLPISVKDLEELSYVAAITGKDGNIYVVLEEGTEEHFGWADTFYIGKLKDGFVVFPYTCTVERNLDSNHPGILNGKLGNADFSKFTLRDVEYLFNHASPIENNLCGVMYAYNTDEGKRLNWLITRFVGEKTVSAAPVEDNSVYAVTEQMPEYPGGTGGMMRDLAKAFRYPPIAVEKNIQGKVVVNIVVERDGSFTIIDTNGASDASLVKEAKRVVGTLAKFTPGKNNGRPVRVKMSIPVNFKLN